MKKYWIDQGSIKLAFSISLLFCIAFQFTSLILLSIFWSRTSKSVAIFLMVVHLLYSCTLILLFPFCLEINYLALIGIHLCISTSLPADNVHSYWSFFHPWYYMHNRGEIVITYSHLRFLLYIVIAPNKLHNLEITQCPRRATYTAIHLHNCRYTMAKWMRILFPSPIQLSVMSKTKKFYQEDELFFW